MVKVTGSISIAASFPLLAPNGTAAAPSYSFLNSTDLGLFRATANVLGIGAAGVHRHSFTSSEYRGGSGVVIGWTSTAAPTGAIDAQLSRTAAGRILLSDGANNFDLLQFGNTTNAFPAFKRSGAEIQTRTADDSGSAVFSARMYKHTMFTVALLPSAAAVGAGTSSFVNDALAPTFGAAVVGGGAVVIRVFSDGAIWRVG